MKKYILSIIVICFIVCGMKDSIVLAETVFPDYIYTRTDEGKLFSDVAVGDDISVLVGKNGRIYIYENETLDSVEIDSFEDFNQVEYTNGKFVVISTDTVFQSTTGKEWDIVSYDNEFQSDGLVIVADDKFIVEKPDGIYETVDFVTYGKISSASSQTNAFASNIKKYDVSERKNSVESTRNYYKMIFGEGDSLNSIIFDKKVALFITLSGIEESSLPVNIDNIEFLEINDSTLLLYYVEDFKLIKAETTDLKTWSKATVDIPEQNSYLNNVIIGKINGDYLLVYDTNTSAGIYKTKKIVKTSDMMNFQDVVTTEIRGDIIAEKGKIFILTSSSVYEVLDGNVKTLIKEETLLNDKKSIITTNNADFMWERDNGIRLLWNNTGEWQEINADNFITSHFINGNANYQIIWTGINYIVRPTDYDNGYNPTGAGGNIEIYDQMFNHIKSVTLNDYILQMSYMNKECYVLTDKNEVLYTCDFENWIKVEETALPLDNGKTQIFKTLTKVPQEYDYIHNVKGIINKNAYKISLYEHWQGSKIDLSSNLYLRYDKNIASYSGDGVYWKDIILPRGITNIQSVRIDDGKYIITTPELELSYSIDTEYVNSIKTYVEIEGKILGFDTEPIIESNRTLVPLRFIFETLGADVDWGDSTRTAIVQNDETTILFSIDNTNAKVNNANKEMDVPARLVNGKTMVPLRFLSEELGFNVEWDEETRTATISK